MTRLWRVSVGVVRMPVFGVWDWAAVRGPGALPYIVSAARVRETNINTVVVDTARRANVLVARFAVDEALAELHQLCRMVTTFKRVRHFVRLQKAGLAAADPLAPPPVIVEWSG